MDRPFAAVLIYVAIILVPTFVGARAAQGAPDDVGEVSESSSLKEGNSLTEEHKRADLSWNSAMTRAKEAMLKGQYVDAQTNLKTALTEARKFGPNNFRVAVTTWELAQSHKERGQYKEAQEDVIEALRVFEAQKPSRPMAYAGALNTLASIHKEQGNYDEAEETYKKAIEILEKHDREKLALAAGLDNLGVLYQRRLLFLKAIPIQQRVLSIYESSPKTSPRDMAICLNNIAESYRYQKQNDKARNSFERAIKLMVDQYGNNHPTVATFKDNLSAVLREEGKNEEAEKLEVEVCEIYRKTLGDNHPDLAIALHNLASLYSSMGKNDKAIVCEREALSIFEKAFGPTHPVTAQSKAQMLQFTRDGAK